MSKFYEALAFPKARGVEISREVVAKRKFYVVKGDTLLAGCNEEFVAHRLAKMLDVVVVDRKPRSTT